MPKTKTNKDLSTAGLIIELALKNTLPELEVIELHHVAPAYLKVKGFIDQTHLENIQQISNSYLAEELQIKSSYYTKDQIKTKNILLPHTKTKSKKIKLTTVGEHQPILFTAPHHPKTSLINNSRG